MSISAYKVRIDAKRQLERLKKNHPGVWLNNDKNPSLEPVYYLRHEKHKEKAKEIFDSFHLTGYKMESKYIQFEILIANILRKRSKPLVVSRNKSDYKNTRYDNKLSDFIIELMDEMIKKGLIAMKKGCYTEELKRKTRIWATKRLLDCFPKLSNDVVYEPTELVILRDANGKLKDYPREHKTANRVRKTLQQANRVNGAADIRFKNYILSGYLTAVYRENFSLYGRLHTRGYRHYQSLNDKKERAEITINGDPVVELDYSGLHPHLLYAQEGIQFEGDPYTIIDERATKDNKILRGFYKESFLALINSSGKWTQPENKRKYWRTAEQNAEACINERICKKKKKEDTEKHKALIRELKKSGISHARQIIDAFKMEHKPIAHHFCTDKTGLKLMNKDAKIALDIVKHFTKQGIPILAIHDSFIVQVQHERKLRSVMDETYRKHTKGFSCPIDKKF